MTVLAFSEKVHAVKKNRINKERQPWFSDRELCSGKKNCPQPLRGCRKVCKSVSMALKPSLSQLCCFPSADMAPVLQYRERVTPFAAPPLRGYRVTRFRGVSKKHYTLTVFPLMPCHIHNRTTTIKKDPLKRRTFLMLRELDHILVAMPKNKRNF